MVLRYIFRLDNAVAAAEIGTLTSISREEEKGRSRYAFRHEIAVSSTVSALCRVKILVAEVACYGKFSSKSHHTRAVPQSHFQHKD